MNGHSPEPWSYDSSYDNINDADDVAVLDIWNPDDAERIVACVNACRGISTEDLKKSIRKENIVLLGRDEVLREAMERAIDVEIVVSEERKT